MKETNNSKTPIEQIKEIEQFYGLIFPATYRQWLLKNNCQPAGNFVGSDCHCSVLLNLKESAEELLNEYGQTFVLGKEDFVFLMHQGYQFLYFKADGSSDDPPVYHYLEGWDNPKQIANSFSEWLRL